MILGLTGGLGCGKSTAAQFFTESGFRRIDSDALVRDHVLVRPEVVAAIGQRFGPGMIGPDGQINRTNLGSVVFADDVARRWLEQLIHPQVFSRWREMLSAAPGARWVVEVPLLFERQLENWFDFVVCVSCAPEQQLSRLEQRGLSRVLAARRISTQLPLARKIELSDFVLLNDGSPSFLQRQIDGLISALPAC
jgi:dephospho-CoA kinase